MVLAAAGCVWGLCAWQWAGVLGVGYADAERLAAARVRRAAAPRCEWVRGVAEGIGRLSALLGPGRGLPAGEACASGCMHASRMGERGT